MAFLVTCVNLYHFWFPFYIMLIMILRAFGKLFQVLMTVIEQMIGMAAGCYCLYVRILRSSTRVSVLSDQLQFSVLQTSMSCKLLNTFAKLQIHLFFLFKFFFFVSSLCLMEGRSHITNSTINSWQEYVYSYARAVFCLHGTSISYIRLVRGVILRLCYTMLSKQAVLMCPCKNLTIPQYPTSAFSYGSSTLLSIENQSVFHSIVRKILNILCLDSFQCCIYFPCGHAGGTQSLYGCSRYAYMPLSNY